MASDPCAAAHCSSSVCRMMRSYLPDKTEGVAALLHSGAALSGSGKLEQLIVYIGVGQAVASDHLLEGNAGAKRHLMPGPLQTLTESNEGLNVAT